ncbi:MAG: ABC transporter substrate-binding protein [Armatimonadetes bacterium]|nr:ABC transporter substrate-binding protein [Armatimonadota bacterium]
MRTRIAVLAVLAVLMTGWSAALSAPATPAPRPGGTLFFVLEADPDRLDPNLSGLRTSQIVFFQIFEPLIVRDPQDRTFKPWLATAWEVSPDGRAYTFRLRRDVKFHDGTPFNAEAVKFNMDRTHNPALASRCGGCAVGFYDSSEVVDQYTVRIRLKQPWAPFLDAMSLFYRMVSPAQVRRVGDQDLGRRPVGTGSFRFVEWVPNDRIVLERNPDHTWAPPIFRNKGAAYVERVHVRIITEPTTRVTALEAGEVHVATAVPPQDFARLSRDPRYQAIIGIQSGVPFVFAVNVTKRPTDELAVRQALNYGIDREQIARAVFGPLQPFGAYKPAYTLLSSITWGYDKGTEMYQHDATRARELLEQAGWKPGPDGIRQKGGERLEARLVSWERGAPEVMQAQLRRIGLDLKVAAMPALAVNEAQRKPESHMTPRPAARTDPDVLSAFLHSRNVGGGGFNFSFVKDPQLDQIFDQAATEVDMNRRRQLYVQAVRLTMQRAYFLPVHARDNVSVTVARVRDLRYDVTGFFPWLHDVWMVP